LSPARATEHVAEATEQIRQVGEVGVHAASAAARRGTGAEEGTGTLVVFPPLLGVGEDIVSVLHLFEALLGLRVLPVSVRVLFTGQFSISTPDIVLRRALIYPEYLVKILRLHT
jgi:hypothetical protein